MDSALPGGPNRSSKESLSNMLYLPYIKGGFLIHCGWIQMLGFHYHPTNTAHWFYHHFFSLVLLHLFSRKSVVQPPTLHGCRPAPTCAPLIQPCTRAALARYSSVVLRLLQPKTVSSCQDTTLSYCPAAAGLWPADLLQQLLLCYTLVLWICTLTKMCCSPSKS